MDTSIWIHHFVRQNVVLTTLLEAGEVLSHPFVIGELAIGNLPQRNRTLGDLRDLPKAVLAGEEEVLSYIERARLYGSGIGYIDVHLLASVKLTANALLWTRDRRLHDIAEKLSLSFVLPG